MNDKNNVFFDTNILLYAHLCQDAHKKDMARELTDESIKRDNCYISTQVVQEFCNNMLKKAGATEVQISKMLHKMERNFNISPVQISTIEKALDVKTRYGFSFWDSLIVAAAISAKCGTLYTEDLSSGQVIDGVLQVINPFSK